MNFEEILDRWEKSQDPGGKSAARPEKPRVDMEAALERYPPGEQGPEAREVKPLNGSPAPSEARCLKDLKPQAVLDLHGLSSTEAEEALDRFIRDSKAQGLAKVLIVHGKGLHSPGQPVLQRVVQNYLEKCPYTGAFARADRTEGGRGATWVLIRETGSIARGR
jgi:DNA-nicking Smr family endonuclease